MAGCFGRVLVSVTRNFSNVTRVSTGYITTNRWRYSHSKSDPFLKSTISNDRLNVLLNAGCGLALSFVFEKKNDKNDSSSLSRDNSTKPSKDFEKNVPPVSHSKTYNFIADVAEKVAPTVVYIQSYTRDPFFSNMHIPLTNGSGFIVKSDGLILTNAHVVANRAHITVKLYDGRTFEGVVEYVDPETDLATIRIPAKDLPVLPLGKSSAIRLGEFVVALGNPLTLKNTITAGVVSAVHRPSKELGLSKECDYIQTDAAINHGNSGGPLVNLNGEAIGINTMKVSEGISFAIPSDRAASFLKEAEAKKGGWWPFNQKKVAETRKYIGITMLTLTPLLVEEFRQRNPDFPVVTHGVLIWRTIVSSPAFEAGLRPGDVITAINKTVIYSTSDVYKMLAKNEALEIEVKRGKSILKFNVKPQEIS